MHEAHTCTQRTLCTHIVPAHVQHCRRLTADTYVLIAVHLAGAGLRSRRIRTIRGVTLPSPARACL
eukprot:6188351-Pleurochrysis_carterae.AAC.1